MKHVTCAICNKSVSLNESIKIDNKVYCGACLTTAFPDDESLVGKSVEKEADPTVCSFCAKDFDTRTLNKISLHPVCEECEVEIKNRTFPKWVKAFFIGIICIVVGAFAWNWKYYLAYKEIKEANQYADAGDATNASILMSKASEKVPEVEGLKTLAAYYHAIELMTNDRSEEALVELNKCIDLLPADYNISALILQAKYGAAFDHKDYPAALVLSLENLAQDSTTAMAWATAASANACVYAERGDPYARQDALRYLEKARAIDDTTKQMRIYYNMIEYRIDSRTIIKRDEFVKKFPDGWTKNP